jgi:hypothetical protein
MTERNVLETKTIITPKEPRKRISVVEPPI